MVYFATIVYRTRSFPNFTFNVRGTLHRQMFILYNKRDANYTIFFIIISALHVSGGFSAHHQELIKVPTHPHQR
jgi:hypothetical protein